MNMIDFYNWGAYNNVATATSNVTVGTYTDWGSAQHINYANTITGTGRYIINQGTTSTPGYWITGSTTIPSNYTYTPSFVGVAVEDLPEITTDELLELLSGEYS